ncbi:hypothetical protein R3P38DRAFT_2776772 [Favolaschia claudopus]|uniref:Uncharacterized protein n=1 Tax=Favolaschia claudopus TaxID=2862362 RepID=A0AAW0BNL7_9AGAR
MAARWAGFGKDDGGKRQACHTITTVSLEVTSDPTTADHLSDPNHFNLLIQNTLFAELRARPIFFPKRTLYVDFDHFAHCELSSGGIDDIFIWACLSHSSAGNALFCQYWLLSAQMDFKEAGISGDQFTA